MGKTLIIAKKDVKEAFRSKTTYFYVILLCLLSLPYFGGVNSVINNLLEQGIASRELDLAIQALMDGVFATLPLVLTMLICSVFSAYSITMDKAKRTLESLLATPLSLSQVWIGKSLAITLPGVGIALLISLLAVLAMNLAIIVPAVGSFTIPNAISLVTGLIIVPVMTFFVVCIVSFLQLVMTNPRIANFVFIGIFFGVYFSTITELTASFDFSLIYLIATVILAAITLLLSRFLTRERVILSSKG
jgi:ABC-type Na+ efflux pump permease subunit